MENQKSESKIQQQIVMWFRSNPNRGIIFSVPNESGNAREQMRKKQIGLLAGVSDLVCLLPGGVTLLMEVKTQTGKQSETQRKFESKSIKLGHSYVVVRSLEHAIDAVEKHTPKRCMDKFSPTGIAIYDGDPYAQIN